MTKVRIGHLSTFYHTAVLLMAQGQADKRLGAEVEWKLMGTGPELMGSFERRELDIAYVGLPPAIIGISRGVDVICVAGGHMEGTVMAGKALWTGYPETKDLDVILKQFRGRRIGVPGRGSIHDVILNECIEQAGLTREIEIKNYPWADLVTEAVANDEVSAAFGTPALAVAIMRFANGKVLYPPSRLWPDNPSYGIVVDREFLAKEANVVERFLGLHEEASGFIRKKPDDAARLIADYVKIVDTRFVLETLMLSPKYCAQLTEGFISATMKFLPVLKKLGYIHADVAEDKIFSRKLIDGIHPEKDHYRDGIEKP